MNIDDIIQNPNNPRYISAQQADRLAKSIEEFPQMMTLRPIVTDDEGMILGGNMRYLALKRLGYTEIPDAWVVKAADLTAAQKREFVIKDNAGFGTWDYEALSEEWGDLPLADWGVDIPGFEDEEPKEKGASLDLADFTLETDHQVNSGEAYKAGDHILFCGKLGTDWPHYTRFLKPEGWQDQTLLVHYGAPFLLLSEKPPKVIVNPDPVACSLMLTKASRAGLQVEKVSDHDQD